MSDGDEAHVRFVLIVEDDSSIAELVKLALEGEFDVRTAIAEDGERGLALARQLKPAVVLLDMNLPKLSGLEVARLLKADPDTQTLALIAMTSMSEAETLSAGCPDHLAKPFDLDELSRIVGKYLGTASTVPKPANQADQVVRLLGRKAAVTAYAARYRSQAREPCHTAKRTTLASSSLRQKSAQLITIARRLQQRAA